MGGGGVTLSPADLKITTGHWPFSVQNCQMANHFPKWLVLLADHQRNMGI